MKAGGLLEQWLRGAKPGRCPCGRKVSARPGAVLCQGSADRGCRAKYLKLFQLDSRGQNLRKPVRSVEPHPTLWGLMRVVLGCRHVELLSPSVAARVGATRTCRRCHPKPYSPEER